MNATIPQGTQLEGESPRSEPCPRVHYQDHNSQETDSNAPQNSAVAGEDTAVDRSLQRLTAMAAAARSKLLDAEWKGADYWYTFELSDGRQVQIRGTKLLATGWPRDVDAYLRWSNARRKPQGVAKTRDTLFLEFKRAVEVNNAVVLAKRWLGARIAHDVLLSDGSIRSIKPNQLKYFGWPVVPLDELRRLVAPYPVHILPDTVDSPAQVFRIMLGGGVYLEGEYNELRTDWASDVAGTIADTVAWAEREGLQLMPTKWKGIHHRYLFVDKAGRSKPRQIPLAQAHEADRLNTQGLAKLRRVGTIHSAKLLSTQFRGSEAVYEWERGGAVLRATSKELIEGARNQGKLDALRKRVDDLGLGATLVSTQWEGMCAAYQWYFPDGSKLTARFSQLRVMANRKTFIDDDGPMGSMNRKTEALVFESGSSGRSLEVLRDWADGVGIKLLSTDWVDRSANYEWALPDGSVVAASLKKVRNCTHALLRLRQSSEEVQPQVSALTKEECPELVCRIAASRSK